MSNKKPNPLLKAAASFNSVSSPPNLDNISKKSAESQVDGRIKSNVEINDNVKIEVAFKDSKRALEELLDSTEKEKKRPLTVYLDQDVWDLLDQFAKPRGKGAKSEVVNQLIKNTFNSK